MSRFPRLSRRTRWLAAAAALAIPLAGAAAGLSATPAFAAVSVSGVTWLPANLDSGNGTASYNGLQGGWAIDSFHRTLTVASSSACSPVPAGSFSCYAATVSDTGTFRTLPGNGRAPNPTSVTDPGKNIAWPPVTGQFSGTAHFLFESDLTPAEANIPDVVDNSSHAAAGAGSTGGWYVNAFAPGAATAHFLNSNGTAISAALQNDWSWSYTTYTGKTDTTTAVACEHWTDAAGNSSGSDPLAGNITGTQCAGTPIPPVQGNFGDEVNPYGNGFDVFRQDYRAGAIVAGWTATKADPATHFVRIAHGSAWQFEAVNGSGIATGLCVSDPGGGWASDPLRDGLLVTGCNNGPWQQFVPQADGTLKNVATGLVVSPAGTGAQLRGTASPVAWGGSKYAWQDIRQLP